jgi:aminopeptidase Y
MGFANMAPSYLSVALLLLGESFASQLPLFDPASTSQIHLAAKKELVSSESFQDRIHADRLFERAKTLYGIAELGEDEYNHPTRVIGSKGTVLLSSLLE